MKYKLFFIILILFSSISVGFAGPVGNIAEMSAMKEGFFSGTDYDIFLEPKYTLADLDLAGNPSNEMESVDYTVYGAKFGTIIKNRGMIYATLGYGSVEKKFNDMFYVSSEENPEIADNVEVSFDIDSKEAFLFGIGGNFIIYEKDFKNGNIIRLGFDLKYRKTGKMKEKNITAIRLDNDEVVQFSELKTIPAYSIQFDEYQTALQFSAQFEDIIPYIGYKLSIFRGEEVLFKEEDEDDGTIHDLKRDIEDACQGLFIGASYKILDSIMIGAEAGFGNENIVTFGTGFRF